jgi:16S rRNA (guanine966-N2)-methyltransferase
MRVIAGQYRGRRLETVDGLAIRPATDRVRQTLFDMLATRIDLEGAAVLDLFAGIGSLGIEALSRGAGRVTFVERDEEATDCIEANLTTLGCLSSAEVIVMDAMAYLGATKGRFDLVFADPPYAFKGTEGIPAAAFAGGLVKPGGYLLIEHSTDIAFTTTSIYSAGPAKKFGRTVVTFFRGVQS